MRAASIWASRRLYVHPYIPVEAREPGAHSSHEVRHPPPPTGGQLFVHPHPRSAKWVFVKQERKGERRREKREYVLQETPLLSPLAPYFFPSGRRRALRLGKGDEGFFHAVRRRAERPQGRRVPLGR
jgi:hypothetical protein